MFFKTYFFELRNRLFLSILVWLSVVLVCYIFKEILLFVITKQTISLKLCFKELFYFIFTDVSEIFYVYMSLIFFVANQVLFLYLCYSLLVFMSSGLYRSEYSYIVFSFTVSMFLFIFSVFLFNKFFFPFMWNFFLTFQRLDLLKSTTFYFESKISEYSLFYISFYYICIFYFQILVILFVVFDFLKTKGVSLIKAFRKFFYYFFVVFSTLITPPDVFSQLALSLCLIFNYEILVFYFILKKIKNQGFLIR